MDEITPAPAEIIALGRAAGFSPMACFTDPNRVFSVHLWTAD